MSGYTETRAFPHDYMLALVVDELAGRGYRVLRLPVDGHAPDARLDSGYVDVKTAYPGQKNVSIEKNDVDEWLGMDAPVYVVFTAAPEPDGWLVESIESLWGRRLGDARPPTGRGSNDWFYLFPRRGWWSFGQVFPWKEAVL